MFEPYANTLSLISANCQSAVGLTGRRASESTEPRSSPAVIFSPLLDATSGHVIAERSQSIEHYGCRGTSGTEGELRRHLIVVVTDADRVFEMPGPEQEPPDGNANLLIR